MPKEVNIVSEEARRTFRKVPAGAVRRLNNFLCYLLFGVVLYLAIAKWYDCSSFKVFAADDLRSFSAAHDGLKTLSQLMTSVQRFRPVTVLAIWAAATWSKCDVQGVVSMGLGLHALNALCFFLLLKRLFRLSFFPSLGLTIIGFLNRFATYLFMQEEAIMEGLCVLMLLGIVWFAWRLIRRSTPGSAFALATLFLLIIHTHERFLVLAGPLLLLGLYAFRFHRPSGIILCAGVIASATLNLLIKKLWLGTPVLVGAATRPIEFNIRQIGSFVRDGTLNLLGINRGPDYLSLEDFAHSPWFIRLICCGGAIVIIFFLGLMIRRICQVKDAPILKAQICFYAVTAMVLLLSASITIRQEYRWLYPAYLVFLICIAAMLKSVTKQSAVAILALNCFIWISVIREIYLAHWHSRFFEVEAYQIANNLYDTLQRIDAMRQEDVISISGDVPSYKWIFMGTKFSRFYRLPQLEFGGRSTASEQIDGKLVVVRYINATCSFVFRPSEQLPQLNDHRMNYSVLIPIVARLKPGEWPTPTKTPIFQTSKNGVACMEMISPVEVAMAVPAGAHTLYACFSHTYAMGDGVDLNIAVETAAGPQTLLSRTVPPLTDTDFPIWRKYEFALPEGAKEVKMRVFSGSGNSTADWLALRDFSFD